MSCLTMKYIPNRDTVIRRLNLMFIGCVDLVFGSKNVQFRIICSF